MAAAAQAVQSAGAESVVVGVPVAPAHAVERIKQLGASVVSVSTPPDFFGVGQFYQDFGQVPDEECIEILERMRGSGARHTETNEGVLLRSGEKLLSPPSLPRVDASGRRAAFRHCIGPNRFGPTPGAGCSARPPPANRRPGAPAWR